MKKDNTAKLIFCAIGSIFGIYILLYLLPYIVMFLAVSGAWFLWQEYLKSKNRKF